MNICSEQECRCRLGAFSFHNFRATPSRTKASRKGDFVFHCKNALDAEMAGKGYTFVWKHCLGMYVSSARLDVCVIRRRREHRLVGDENTDMLSLAILPILVVLPPAWYPHCSACFVTPSTCVLCVYVSGKSTNTGGGLLFPPGADRTPSPASLRRSQLEMADLPIPPGGSTRSTKARLGSVRSESSLRDGYVCRCSCYDITSYVTWLLSTLAGWLVVPLSRSLAGEFYRLRTDERMNERRFLGLLRRVNTRRLPGCAR